MLTLVSAVSRYATWLFVLLGTLALRQAWLLLRSLAHRRTSLFNLERETAASKMQQAMVALLLYGTLIVGVHTIAFKVAPTLPADALRSGHSPPIIQKPPTADLPTDTPTPPPYTATPPPLVIITSTAPTP